MDIGAAERSPVPPTADAAEPPALQDVRRRSEGAGRDVLLDLSGLTFTDGA